MSTPKGPLPAQYILAVLYKDPVEWELVLPEVEAVMGEMKQATDPQPFTFTEYYTREMGEGILRRYCVMGQLRSPTDLPDIKLATNEIEKKYALDGKRRINLDPGYLTKHQLILATGKAGGARPYLDKGIYAYIALRYNHGSYHPVPWAYSDYKQQDTIAFFNNLRQLVLMEEPKGLADEEES